MATVRLPSAPDQYDKEIESQTRRLIMDFLQGVPGNIGGSGTSAGGGGGAGGIGAVMHWRGAFNILTQYYPGDTVTWGGGLFMFTTASKGKYPPLVPRASDTIKTISPIDYANATMSVRIVGESGTKSTSNTYSGGTFSFPQPSDVTQADVDAFQTYFTSVSTPTMFGTPPAHSSPLIFAGKPGVTQTVAVSVSADLVVGDLTLDISDQITWEVDNADSSTIWAPGSSPVGSGSNPPSLSSLSPTSISASMALTALVTGNAFGLNFRASLFGDLNQQNSAPYISALEQALGYSP